MRPINKDRGCNPDATNNNNNNNNNNASGAEKGT